MTAETGGSLTEAEGVAVVGTEDAKTVPEAASDEAWAASWLELAGREESPWELATLAGTLQARRLATCWAESTCWTALAMAARKAGDMGETTDLEDRAVEAKLDSDGADNNSRGISSDSCTRDKASYTADWLL